MIDFTIHFIIYGKPQPAGSKRGFAFKRQNGSTGVAISDANPKSRQWKNLVSDAVQAIYRGPLLRGALAADFVFYAPRPRGHFGTGRNAAILKASAPAYPTARPDVLKLARGVEDALSKVLYLDDAQIVKETIEKCYGEPARVEVTIRELSGECA